MTVRIYIEGGGDDKATDIAFRNGWTEFFKSAKLAGQMPRVVRGKGRQATWDLFSSAVAHAAPDEAVLLLVDSEDRVKPGGTVAGHLRDREGWKAPGQAADNLFLMVTSMETWLLADRDALRREFHPNFRPGALKEWPHLENLSRQEALAALERCTGGKYRKGKISFQLLAAVNPATVEARCPAAKLLLDRLRKPK